MYGYKTCQSQRTSQINRISEVKIQGKSTEVTGDRVENFARR